MLFVCYFELWFSNIAVLLQACRSIINYSSPSRLHGWAWQKLTNFQCLMTLFTNDSPFQKVRICEQSFAKVKFIKSWSRSLLDDEKLESNIQVLMYIYSWMLRREWQRNNDKLLSEIDSSFKNMCVCKIKWVN